VDKSGSGLGLIAGFGISGDELRFLQMEILPLVPRLRMHGAIPQLPHKSSWLVA